MIRIRIVLMTLGLAVVATSARATAQDPDLLTNCVSSTGREQILACTTAIVSAKLTPDQTIQAYRSRGNEYLRIGDYQHAIADETTILDANPTDPAALRDRGYASDQDALRHSGNYESAIADETKAIATDPRDAVAYKYRGLAYEHASDHQHAIADETEAIRLSPNDPDEFEDRGTSYVSIGDYGRAVADFTAILRLKPDDSWAYYLRAQAQGHRGRYDLAVADYTSAIRIEPDFPVAYNSRAIAYIKLSQFERAIADETAAIRIWLPLNTTAELAMAYATRGSAYANLRQFDPAVADFTRAIDLEPKDAMLFFKRGVVYKERGDLALARRNFDEAVRLDPALASHSITNENAVTDSLSAATSSDAGLVKPTMQALYQRALTLFKETRRAAPGASAMPGTAPVLLALIDKAPNGPYAEKARQMLRSLEASKVKFPDWDGRLGRHEGSKHVSIAGNAPAPEATEAAAPKGMSAPLVPPMYVSFSFSTPGLAGFGGDGAWGAAVSRDRQSAMNNAGASCSSHSHRDWCGTGNGGTFQACRPVPEIRWVALAISNDGTLENWSDGEAIGYSSENAAGANAMADCGKSTCHVVWTTAVQCGAAPASATGNGKYANVLSGCVHTAGYDNNSGRMSYRNECSQAATVMFYEPGNAGKRAVVDIGAGEVLTVNIPVQMGEVLLWEACPQGYHLVDKFSGVSLNQGSQSEACAR